MSLFTSIFSSNPPQATPALRFNGRINIMQPPNPLQMHERITLRNKATEYREALHGTWEDNELSTLYFSAKNIHSLQLGICQGVREKSNGKIISPPPNIDVLKIIMRSIYLQFAAHYQADIPGQVQQLNQRVFDFAVPTLYSEAIGYLRYREDQSTLVVPLAPPQPVDRVYKQLELQPFF